MLDNQGKGFQIEPVKRIRSREIIFYLQVMMNFGSLTVIAGNVFEKLCPSDN